MRRHLIRFQQWAFKSSVYAFVCGLAVVGFGIAGAALRELARPAGSQMGFANLLAWGELAAFAVMLWYAVERLNSRGGAFARTLPGGPDTRLAYLERQLFGLRVALAMGFGAFLVAFAGAAGMSASAFVTRIAFAVVAAWTASDAALALAIVLGSWTAYLAAAALLTGCLAVVHGVASGDPTLAGLAGATAWCPSLAALVPTSWTLRPALLSASEVPSWLRLTALAGVSVAVRLALLGLMQTLFLDPARTQVGARRPPVAGSEVPRDLRPRVTPSLPEPLWITARLMAWHGDAIVPRVLSVTMAGLALLVLIRFAVPRPDTRGPAELATLLGALTVIAAWTSVARIRALLGALLQGARWSRWSRCYPAWALYPLGPWTTGLHQVALILAIGSVSGVPLLLAGAALFPLVRVDEVGIGFLVMVGMVAASCGGIAMLEVVNKCTTSPQTRALHPWRRIVRSAAGAVSGLILLVLAISAGPVPTAVLCFLAGGATLGALASAARRVDRAGGYDVIEVPQVGNPAHLHR